MLLHLALVVATIVAPPTRATRDVTLDHGAQDPAISPDGRRVAVGILGHIYIVPITGGTAQQVTDGVGWDSFPAWSADGQFLAYSHESAGGSDIVLRNVATGASRFVYHNESDIGQKQFDPNGGAIYFVLAKNQYDAHLWRAPLGDGEPKQLTFTTNWHEWSFALSPDGSEILLESGRFGGPDLYLLKTASLEATRLTRTPQKEFAVAWSRTGRQMWIVEDNGVDHVMLKPSSDAAPKEIFSSLYDGKQLALSPDGKTAVLCAGRRLLRIDVETGALTPVAFTAHLVLPDRQRGDLAIVNARVFTGTSNEYVPNATVVVRDGRIVSVTPNAPRASVPAGVPVIDANGKALVAGLMDNHWHYWDPFVGGALLARGVTTIRDPGVAISMSMNFKDAIALGALPGPTIYSAGPLIDGMGGYHPYVDVELDRPEAAAPLVRALKAQGVDALKVYFMLEPPVLAAVIAEAKKQGLPVTGHIGVRTGLGEAMQAGIDGFSHVRVWKDLAPKEIQPNGAEESLDGTKAPVARMQADWSAIDPDGAPVKALIDAMVSHHIALDPTLAIQQIGERSRSTFSLEEYSVARQSYDRMARFVKRAFDAGVPILAGTDDDNLFDELDAYAAAGIPPADVIRTATVNGAKWLGHADDFGTIEPGKRANLVLVDGDPLRNISDMRKITTVVQDGRVVVRR